MDYTRISDAPYWETEAQEHPSIENYYALQCVYRYQDCIWEQLRILDLIIEEYRTLEDADTQGLYARAWLTRCDLWGNIDGEAFITAEGDAYGYYRLPTPETIGIDTLYDDLIERYTDSDNSELSEIVQLAIYKKTAYQSQYLDDSERRAIYQKILDGLMVSDSTEFVAYRLFVQEYLLQLEDNRTTPLWRSRVDEIHTPYIRHSDLDIRLRCARFYDFFVYSQIPSESIVLIDTFVENFGDITLHAIQERCVGHLYHKADMLDESLDDRPGAIDTYTDIITRTYHKWRNMSYRAIVKKGCLLGRLKHFDEAIDICELIISDNRIDTTQDTISREWWLMAIGNQIEYLILTGQYDRAREQCNMLISHTQDHHREEHTIAMFQLWLMSADPIMNHDILVDLPTPMSWGFDEIRLYIETLPIEKKIQAETYIRFFEGKITLDELNV